MNPPDPEELAAAGAPAVAEIPPDTHLGAVQLSVADLDRSIAYYRTVVGLSVLRQDDGRVVLGAGGETDLLELVEQPGARPARGHAGLYHFALVVPGRADLARWLAHAARDRVPLVGLSDHFVSESIYLSDPDEHGIEIYWDRPRALWEGLVGRRMTTLPLDTNSLFAELADPASEPFDSLAAGTRMGHVHLRVSDVDETIVFYRDVLGFALMASLGRQAAFLSAGGYHHHVGANTWESAGTTQPPPGTATLLHATIVLPDAVARDRIVDSAARVGMTPRDTGQGLLVRDPSGNPLMLMSAA